MERSLQLLKLTRLIKTRQGARTEIVRNEQRELPATYTEALHRYQDFLSNPNIAEEAKDRVIELLDSQIGTGELAIEEKQNA